ncbi:MAG: thiamine-binding protein [Euryarchaeota archaeon]|nr:thiamine-binding protein [Euryarchaeota archaeon]
MATGSSGPAMIAHLSITAPPSDGASAGRYVRRAVEVLYASGLPHEVHARGTEVEFGAPDDRFRVVEAIDPELVKIGAERVTIQLKIDDRRDRAVTRADKVRSATGAPRKPRPKR